MEDRHHGSRREEKDLEEHRGSRREEKAKDGRREEQAKDGRKEAKAKEDLDLVAGSDGMTDRRDR